MRQAKILVGAAVLWTVPWLYVHQRRQERATGVLYGAESGPGRAVPNERPLAGALVVLRGPDGREQRVETDAQGRFGFLLDPARPAAYRLLFCASGYQPVAVVPAGGDAAYGLPPVGGPTVPLRTWGWTGRVPAECGASDTLTRTSACGP